MFTQLRAGQSAREFDRGIPVLGMMVRVEPTQLPFWVPHEFVDCGTGHRCRVRATSRHPWQEVEQNRTVGCGRERRQHGSRECSVEFVCVETFREQRRPREDLQRRMQDERVAPFRSTWFVARIDSSRRGDGVYRRVLHRFEPQGTRRLPFIELDS
jgi:hypothetical protein